MQSYRPFAEREAGIASNHLPGAPIIIGIIQLAKPTNAGITTPKIMTIACSVVMELKNIGSTIWIPGWNNSARIISAIPPPIKNMTKENHRYSVPISLWLVVVTQRIKPLAGPCSWWS